MIRNSRQWVRGRVVAETNEPVVPGGGLTSELLRKVKRIEIRSRRLVNNLFVGQYHAVFRGRGIEFSEVREYSPGDEVRTIDWNVTARLGTPFIKKFVEERELSVLLLVDVSASGAFGTVAQTKREVAAEIVALLALSASDNQDRVGLLAFTNEIEKYIVPAKGQRHVLRLVRELLALQPLNRGTRIGAAVDYVSRILKRRSVVFIISDFCDSGDYERPLRVLGQKHDVIAVALADPRDEELPNIGLLELEDAESGETVLGDTSDVRVRRHYRATVEAARADRQRIFRTNSIDAIEINTAASYVEPVLALFRRREGSGGTGRGRRALSA